LRPGEQKSVTFTVPADVTSFIGVEGHRVVEPGDVELRFGRSSGQFAATLPLTLTGPERVVGHHRRLVVAARVEAS
jgi:beta-xylosidase